jgi:hypothetical protein
VKWTRTGTGKLKGLRAKGTSQGSGSADGTAIRVVEGECQAKK